MPLDRKATSAMEQDVSVMEERLGRLRASMAADRDRRDASRRVNPTGSTWRSSRTDVPVGSKYSKTVLAGGAEAPASRAPAPPVRPLISDHGAACSAGTTTDGLGGTRAGMFEWNPNASVAGGEDGVYESLLGPEPDEHPPPPSSGGGALLQGSYDPDAASASFRDAVAAWRGGGAAPTASASATPTASAPAAPTLAASVRALSAELGIEPGLPLAQAIAAANSAVGLPGGGTLTAQVRIRV